MTIGAPAHDIRLRATLHRAQFMLEVDLTVPAAGVTVLYGPSGSGKTSLLRCVAGLERPRSAWVSIAGEVWQDDEHGLWVPTHHRAVGYVFQEASLFEHLDVRANVLYGVRRGARRGVRATAPDFDLSAVTELLGIGHLLGRRPAQLSGGERQRVAIARALAAHPHLLLLDEPLAAIDPARRDDILPWLERLRDELQLPMLYVTHSADELVRLARTLVVLDAGRVRAHGPVHEVLASLHPPVSVGEDAGAILHATVAERDASWGLARLKLAGGELWVRDAGTEVGRVVRLRLLARDISLSLDRPQRTSVQNQLACSVEAHVDDTHPSQMLVQLRCGNDLLLARVTRRAWHALGLGVGRSVWAQVKAVALLP